MVCADNAPACACRLLVLASVGFECVCREGAARGGLLREITKCKMFWGQQTWAQILTSFTNFTSLSLDFFIYKMGVILLISELWLVQLKVLTYFKGLGMEQEFLFSLSLLGITPCLFKTLVLRLPPLTI